MTEAVRNGDEQIEGGLGPVSIKIRGREAVVVMLILVIILGATGFFWKELQAQNEQLAAHDKTLVTQHAMFQQQHSDIRDSLEALIYVNSLSPEEKKTLKLEMPAKLRDMQRR